MARARRWAYGDGTAWAMPILMRCLTFAHDPGLGPTFRLHPVVLVKRLDALGMSWLVSVVGLPGVEKTEIGKEIAQQALARRH